jgi:hypothetical protein
LEDLAGSEEVVKIQISKFFARIRDGVHVAPKKAPGFLGYSSSSSWLGDGVAKDKGKKQEAGVSLVTRETDEGGSRTKDNDDDEDEEDWGTGESRSAIVWIEAIDQAGQHGYDNDKHFFPGAKTMNPCSTQ